MTDTELREIDAQVHREVMGIVWDETRCRVCGWPIVPEGEQGCWASNCGMRPLPERRADEPAKYSTNISHAWNVHQLICGRLFSVRRRYYAALQEIASEGCSFIVAWPDVLTILRDRLPLAICLAAMKAVRGDMGQSGA